MYPASMIWPENLVSVTLLNAMYEKDSPPDRKVLGGAMPRLKWFALVSAGSFFYFFIPGFLARFLSVFAFPTWIAPQNAVVNQLFGGTSGLSLLPLTFDWTQVAGYINSPLIPPWSVSPLNPFHAMSLLIIFLSLQACNRKHSYWRRRVFHFSVVRVALQWCLVLGLPPDERRQHV